MGAASFLKIRIPNSGPSLPLPIYAKRGLKNAPPRAVQCTLLSAFSLSAPFSPSSPCASCHPRAPAFEATVSFSAPVMMPSLGSREPQPWLVSCFRPSWGTPRRAKMPRTCVWLSGLLLRPRHCPGLAAGRASSPGRGLSGPHPPHPRYGLDWGPTVRLIPGCAL